MLLYHIVVILLFAGFAQCDDPGQPLILSKYLPSDPAKAKSLSRVTIPGYQFPSYSGLFTVNETFNSNTFFWLFEAEFSPSIAQTLIWFQGGPGASSLFGLFSELGPFSVNTQLQLVSNPFRWTREFNILFIDNPVGVGFSFTDDVRGFSNDQTVIGENMFFLVFPELKKNEFYVTGESYAGKYVPSVAYAIHEHNRKFPADKLPLTGVAIGDGLMDPLTQLKGYSHLAYYFSLADESERRVIQEYEDRYLSAIEHHRYMEAFDLFDEMINGDFYPYPTYFFNITGSTDYFNIFTPVYPPNPYGTYLQLNETRARIHVGSLPYWDYNKTVEIHLKLDWMISVKHKVETLLDNNYKVLIYNGQNDLILSGPLCEQFLRTMSWSGEREYRESKKSVWKFKGQNDTVLAGYVRHVKNFWQVIVRGAGHMVPADQPSAALNMITNFVQNQPFA